MNRDPFNPRRAGEYPVVVVAGPTASGKSGLALAIATAFEGTIINADSMQVYRDLEILTARPGEAARARAPHRLYGVLDGADPCSAGRWRDLALKETEQALAAGRLPIVVGGTGLYLRSLMRGMASIPEVAPQFRQQASDLHRRIGGEAFHQALAERDPAMAVRLRPSDTQRLIRAWEVFAATGRSLDEWQKELPVPPTHKFLVFLLLPPREHLYRAADQRFDAMIEAGALDEVEALVARRLDPALPVMKSLGVKPLAAYLAGQISRQQAIELGKRDTRRYAKRQFTWLKTQLPSDAPNATVFNEQFSESFCPKIFSIIREFGLTPRA